MTDLSLTEAIRDPLPNMTVQAKVLDIAREVQKRTTVELLDNTIRLMQPTGNLVDEWA